MQLPRSVWLVALLPFSVVTACGSGHAPDVMLLAGRCDSVPAPLAPGEYRGDALPRSAVAPADSGLVLGVVTEAQSGRALRSAGVSLARGAGAAPTRVAPEVTTDSAGGFVLGPQPPGRYTLRVRAIQHVPEERPLELRTGGVDTVRIAMRYFRCVGY